MSVLWRAKWRAKSTVSRIEANWGTMMNKIPIKLRATDQSTRSVNSCENGIVNV